MTLIQRPQDQPARSRAQIQAERPGNPGPPVLWGVFDVWSLTHPDVRYAVWWRIPGRKQGRAHVTESGAVGTPPTHSTAHTELMRCSGTGADWTAMTQVWFDRYVRPHLSAAQSERAIKVTRHWTTTAHSCGIRPHPFTPGVTEVFEMSTEYGADTRVPRGHAPMAERDRGTWDDAAARICRFRCRQTRLRVQLRGTRLLMLLGSGGLRDVSYGRSDFAGFTHAAAAPLNALTDLLATRTCTPAQLAAYHQAFPEPNWRAQDLADRILCARRPDLLPHPALRAYLRWLPAQQWQRWLRRKESAGQTFKRLCGTVPRHVRSALATSNGLLLAASLEGGGITNPGLKAQVLSAFLALSAAHATQTGSVDDEPHTQYELDLGWYVRHVGQHRAAAELRGALRWPRRTTPGVPDRTLHMYNVADVLRDAGRMQREIAVLHPTFALPAADRGILRLHDQLALTHGKLNLEDLPIPSSAARRHARLDVTLQNAQGRTVSFTRAARVHDLVQASADLHNCVSSYHAAAVDGSQVIVLAREDGALRVCLNVRNGRLGQFMFDHNTPPATADQRSLAGAYQAAAGLEGPYPDTGGWWPLEALDTAA